MLLLGLLILRLGILTLLTPVRCSWITALRPLGLQETPFAWLVPLTLLIWRVNLGALGTVYGWVRALGLCRNGRNLLLGLPGLAVKLGPRAGRLVRLGTV